MNAVLEAEKSHDLPSVIRRPKEASSVVLFQITRLEGQSERTLQPLRTGPALAPLCSQLPLPALHCPQDACEEDVLLE